MFNSNASANTKIAVLEERLSSYELMMRKIDEAIQIMGKTSQNISKMLAVHEEKIEQCGKSDELIIQMIHDNKEQNEIHCKEVAEKINAVESRVQEFVKFRWIIVGILMMASFAFSQSSVVIDVLTPDSSPARIEGR